MGPFGCYQMDYLHCTCGECTACTHRALTQEKERKEKVAAALVGFGKRVENGQYMSPAQHRQNAKKK